MGDSNFSEELNDLIDQIQLAIKKNNKEKGGKKRNFEEIQTVKTKKTKI